jgi:hypothetical protein
MIAAMTRTETSMATRCWDAVNDARGRINRLHPMIAEPDNSGPDTGTIGRHAPESSEPWGRQAASAYFDLYFGAREYARAMRGAAGMRRPADVCGHEALDIVDAMVTISQPFILRGVTRGLERLVRQADQVPGIDEGEPWAALPNLPGHQPLACPYCRTYGLRMLKRKGEVKCFFPGCKDSDGSPTRARLEPGRMTGEARLIFGDGIMMGGAA